MPSPFILSSRSRPRSTLFPYTTLFRSMVALQVPVIAHLLAVAVLTAVLVPAAVRRFLPAAVDRKSTRLNSSHQIISYAVFCSKKKSLADSCRQAARHGCVRRGQQPHAG